MRALEGTPDIKVITGMRRSGKSTIMEAFADEVRRKRPAANVVYIDLLDLDNEDLLEYHELHSRVTGSYAPGGSNYLFVDEVQLCDGFEKAINSLHARGGWDIYLTGSNAFLLSSDLATLFTGRHVELHVLPFGFEEYLRYRGAPASDADALLDEYVRRGGLAGSYAYPDERDAAGYVRDVYRTVITRDLAQKYKLPDTAMLERLAEFMLDNAGNLNSPNRIADSLTAAGSQTNHVTVGRYISYLEDAFMFYRAKRYDIRGKKYLETIEKHYVADTGMRYAVLGTRNMDWGRMYENLVYLELMRRGWEVHVGKLYQKEVDFVARRGSEQVYIQVSDDVSGPATLKREISPLLAIRDAYPKVLVARTGHPEYTVDGVVVANLADWLVD
ncbi:MAG: ATP-binding protein [Eggerthellaceae bacterium]|nr:ATP-binding protein [Eggerthellaceae bacterium]